MKDDSVIQTGFPTNAQRKKAMSKPVDIHKVQKGCDRQKVHAFYNLHKMIHTFYFGHAHARE